MSKTDKDTDQNFISVVARPKEGFRRAGYAFSSDKPTVIKISDLTEEQIEQLKNEPNLVVVETGGEPAPVEKAADTTALETQLAEAEKKLKAAVDAEKASQKELEDTKAKLAAVEEKLKAKPADGDDGKSKGKK